MTCFERAAASRDVRESLNIRLWERSVRLDCRHFTGASPCAPHKEDGRSCEACVAFEPTSRRVLIVKLGAAGDVLRTTCVLPAIRAQDPSAQITWITERPSIPLLEGNPYIDRIVARDAAVERLLVERFDVVLGLDSDESGAAIATLAGAQHRYGFVLDGAGRVRPAEGAAEGWWAMGVDDALKRANRRTYPEILYQMCALTGPPARPQFVVPPDLQWDIRQRFAAPLAPFEFVLVLNTGGGRRGEQKQWTARHYAAFVALVRRRHPAWAVVVTAGPDEGVANASLLASIRDEGVVDGGCDHSLKAFGALLMAGDLVVTSDSLGLHMAIALGVPAVALVGPTSPWELEMYGNGEVVHAEVPCLACYQRRCPLPVTCMERLTPQRVLESVERVATKSFARRECGSAMSGTETARFARSELVANYGETDSVAGRPARDIHRVRPDRASGRHQELSNF
jgi:heptosyltransferase-2